MKLRNDYSFSDNLLCFWATLTLSVLAVSSLGLRYATKPISCNMPAHYTDGMSDFAHHSCFEKDYIYFPLDPENEPLPDQYPKPQYTYHRWVPFALGVAAILCLLPHALWCALSGLLWIDSHTLVQSLSDNQRQHAAERHVILRDTALLVHVGLKEGKWTLAVATALRKLLVVLVCVVQVMLAALVFKPELNIGERNETAPDFNVSVPLPERFLCDVTFRRMQHVHRDTLECTMPLTPMYNKGFAFLFYFFVFLALLCLLDTIAWACRLFVPGLRDSPLKRYLAVGGSDSQGPSAVGSFLDSLGGDVHLLIAATADYSGALTAADLANHLWLIYKSGLSVSSIPASSGPNPTSLGPASPPGYALPGSSGTKIEGAAGHDPASFPLLPMAGQGQG